MKLNPKLRAAVVWFARLESPLDIRDLFTFGGLAMVGNGTHMIYPPAAWIVVGAVLYWIGIRHGHSVKH